MLRTRSRRGFTLIEMMIALAIAGFVISALYGVFTIQSRQLITQDLNMEMHQNQRFAVDMVTRSVRMAGNGAAARVSGLYGPNGSDHNEYLPVIVPYDGGGSDPDAITVVYADSSLLFQTRNDEVPSCNTTSLGVRVDMLDYADKLAQYQSGELLMCMHYADTSGIKSYMWSLTGSPDLTNGIIYVNDLSSYTDYSAWCSSADNVPPVISCSKGNIITFYVDDDNDGVGPGTDTHPTLMMDMNMNWPSSDDVPLVDHIEDFQVEYCLDDGTASVDCSVAANWVSSFDTDDVENVWMVRLSFLARSAREDFRDNFTTTRPALGNRSGGTTSSDHYLRQVITTEVTVRNLRYQASVQ